METEGRRRTITGSNINRICILIGYLFALLILGLVSATLHYVIQVWNNTNDSSTSPPNDTKNTEQFLRSLSLPMRFPGYFRSPEEQKLAEESLLTSSFISVPNGSVVGLVNTCSGVCHKPIDWTPVFASTVYHSCCVSYTSYESPTWMIDLSGKNRTLATFNGTKQYFVKDTCIQVTGCDACQCKLLPTDITAVAENVNKTDYEIAWFRRPGCCKCINV